MTTRGAGVRGDRHTRGIRRMMVDALLRTGEGRRADVAREAGVSRQYVAERARALGLPLPRAARRREVARVVKRHPGWTAKRIERATGAHHSLVTSLRAARGSTPSRDGVPLRVERSRWWRAARDGVFACGWCLRCIAERYDVSTSEACRMRRRALEYYGAGHFAFPPERGPCRPGCARTRPNTRRSRT